MEVKKQYRLFVYVSDLMRISGKSQTWAFRENRDIRKHFGLSKRAPLTVNDLAIYYDRSIEELLPYFQY